MVYYNYSTDSRFQIIVDFKTNNLHNTKCIYFATNEFSYISGKFPKVENGYAVLLQNK